MCSKAAFALSHGTLFTRNCIFVYMYYGKAAVSSFLAVRRRRYRVACRRQAAVPCGLAARRGAWGASVCPIGGGGLAWVRKVVA